MSQVKLLISLEISPAAYLTDKAKNPGSFFVDHIGILNSFAPESPLVRWDYMYMLPCLVQSFDVIEGIFFFITFSVNWSGALW